MNNSHSLFLQELLWSSNEKKQAHESRKVRFTLPSQDFILTIPCVDFSDSRNPQQLCMLLPHTSDDSSPGKFGSAVYIRGFEAVYQNSLPGTALRCWQLVAASPQVHCLFQPRNTGEGWRETVCSSFCQITWIMMPSSLGTFRRMRVCCPCHTANDPFVW